MARKPIHPGEHLTEELEALDMRAAELARHWEMLLEYVRQHSGALDRKVADLIGAALEALGSLARDLNQGAQESTDVVRLLEDIQKVTGKPTGKKKKEAPAQPVEVDQAYLGIYLDETEQNIAHFNDDLVILEKNPDDPARINNLFRVIHTIKGSSAMMNISDAREIAHAMENILVIARESRQAFPEMFPLLFAGIDTISSIIFSLRNKTEVPADAVSLIGKLKQYVQSSPVEKRRKDDLPKMAAASKSARKILAQALARHDTIFRILIALEANTPLKGMKASLVEEHLNGRGTVVVMHPRAEDIHDLRQGQVKIGILFALLGPQGAAAGAQEIIEPVLTAEATE